MIICFLRRIADPLQRIVKAHFGEETQRVEVVLLDSARGLTAERVHVVHCSRFVGCYDQHQGIQSDPNREYVSYTRGRLSTTVWLEMEPLGTPEQAEG
eukprot:4982291-Amphidinium_carterae.1